MANGDAAAAAGLRVVPATEDVRQGYDAINERGDELANHMTTGTHTWAQVTGKPTTFAPSAHTHAQSDVIGLSTSLASLSSSLAGKANVTHTHGGGDITSAVNAANHAEGPTSASYNRNATGSGYFAVWMNSSLQFMRNTSARKYKENIAPHVIEPADVLALEPVTYHRKSESDPDAREFGLIADDVEQTLPEIVTYFDGQVDGVRYDLLAVALLAVVKDLTARVEQLEAGL